MATAAVLPARNADVPSAERLEPGSVNIAVARFPGVASQDPPTDPDGIATKVIDAVNKRLAASDADGLIACFQGGADDSCYLRDHLAMTWDYRTVTGQKKLAEFFDQVKGECGSLGLKKVTINRESAYRAPRFGPLDPTKEDTKGLLFFIDFESEKGTGIGMCRLVEASKDEWKIFSFFTTLRELNGFPEAAGPTRPPGVAHGDHPQRKNWKERREAETNLEDGAEPVVLVIGAGQGGLTSAARLKLLGLNTLIVDRNERIGDNWRNRYHQLVLHDPVWYDHMPYMHFPQHWPIFTPKDKLADWFELYAQVLELNVWMKSTLTKSSWDENSQTWEVTIERTKADGSKETRVLHPRHIIQATGHSGKKNFPTIKGMDGFKGTRLCHSSEFTGAKPNGNGKKVIVVGCCNSGHDISHTYQENGYDVTMVQRSTTCVISSASITGIALAGLYSEDGPPVDDADVWLYGTPSSMLKRIQVGVTALQNEADKEILQGLEKAGFKLDQGPDSAGLFFKYFQRGGGYYIDVGASKLIAEGKIKIKQGQEISEVLEHGLKFADGSELEGDEIIFATGYQNMRSEARSIFGDELADRVNNVWGYDEEGEFRTMWRSSGHPGFWFMGGNLAFCRYYSKLLALQIKAKEEGLR